MHCTPTVPWEGLISVVSQMRKKQKWYETYDSPILNLSGCFTEVAEISADPNIHLKEIVVISSQVYDFLERLQPDSSLEVIEFNPPEWGDDLDGEDREIGPDVIVPSVRTLHFGIYSFSSISSTDIALFNLDCPFQNTKIAKLLRRFPNLQEIKCGSTGGHVLCLGNILESLCFHAFLTKLDLRHNDSQSCNAADIAEFLKINTTLRHLDLRGLSELHSLILWMLSSVYHNTHRRSTYLHRDRSRWTCCKEDNTSTRSPSQYSNVAPGG